MAAVALFIRFFVVIGAFWLASLAAGLTLVLGAVAPGGTILAGDHTAPVLWFLVLTTSLFVAAFSFVPAIIFILLAESFAWRSVVVYAIAGSAIGLFCGYSFGFLEWMPGPRLELSLDQNAELMAGAGIAAGLVYWAVAGRTAGAWKKSAAASPTNS